MFFAVVLQNLTRGSARNRVGIGGRERSMRMMESGRMPLEWRYDN